MPSLHIKDITLELFNTTLKRYSEVASSSLAELDTLRYETIPAKLAKNKKDAHLLKTDVEKLVEWKLKHGTFRPTLMNLVKQNSTDTVQETTRSAFSEPDPMKAVKTLTALRGIGPATASLLLSVRQPNTVPFFSDELFRWSQWDVVGKKGAGDGWDRKIKYNVGEYKALLESVGVLRERLGVWAVDAEKVAYVLGKEMANINGDGDGEVKVEPVKEEVDKKEKSGDAQEESAKRVQEALAEIRGEKARGVNGSEEEQKAKSEGSEKMAEDEKKSGTKRKAKEGIVPAEATRRSARRKT